jgi:hypothetical protein
MESPTITVTPRPAKPAVPFQRQRTISPHSSISSVRFAIPSDCASSTSSFEKNFSYWATTTVKSPNASKRDTGSTLGSLYENLAPEPTYTLPYLRNSMNSMRSVSAAMPKWPPACGDDTRSVGGSSLTSMSISRVLHYYPHLDIRIRRSKSEFQELAIAVSNLNAMYSFT